MVEANSEACRELFKSLGLTYEDAKRNIDSLVALLEHNLEYYCSQGVSMCMNLSDYRIAFTDSFYLKVDGLYFKDRECISFNPDGFIGFCGWASSANSIPICSAFTQWCHIIVANKKELAYRLTI
jgi:hypothetical protein